MISSLNVFLLGMAPAKNLEYTIINEGVYHGEGHIINISKRHTNRRWRQFTPEKQCNIELEMVKASIITAIELKGFGTYIVEISFKDSQNKLVTKIKYNFNFQDEAIKQEIVCQTQTGIKYVDLKLINNQSNPRRMGINHFFMKGTTITKQGQQKYDSDEENKKQRKKKPPSQVWVRKKTSGDDPWGLDQVSQDQEPQWKVKGSEIVKNVDKGKQKNTNVQKVIINNFFKKKPIDKENQQNQKQQCEQKILKKELQGQNIKNQSQMTEISQPHKKSKPNQSIEKIKLQIEKNSDEKDKKGKSSMNFESKFLFLKKDKEVKKENSKQINLEESQDQKKMRIKNELILKLKEKVNSVKK